MVGVRVDNLALEELLEAHGSLHAVLRKLREWCGGATRAHPPPTTDVTAHPPATTDVTPPCPPR
eukprot:1725386-Prymnesium_polylepis.1